MKLFSRILRFLSGSPHDRPLTDKDRQVIANLNKMKTLRVVNGAIYVDASDLKDELNLLREQTKVLFPPAKSSNPPSA